MHGKFSTVIVEATSPQNANDIAVCAYDIYFDGVEDDVDCACCGDRWERCSKSDPGYIIPAIYGSSIYCCTRNIDKYKFPALIIYKDGHKEELYWSRFRVYKKTSFFSELWRSIFDVIRRFSK